MEGEESMERVCLGAEYGSRPNMRHRQYLYFCTSKASKLSTSLSVLVAARELSHMAHMAIKNESRTRASSRAKMYEASDYRLAV